MPSPKKYGPNSHWIPSELKLLKELSKTHTSAEIAAILGRSKGAVQGQAHRKGIVLNSRKTATYKGRIAEKHALFYLPGAKLLTKDNYHAPYDIEWQNKRVNVKGVSLSYNKHARCSYWTFRIRDAWENCDLFLFLGYVKGEEMPREAWIVPSSLCQRPSVSMSENSKKGRYAPFKLKIKEDTKCVS